MGDTILSLQARVAELEQQLALCHEARRETRRLMRLAMLVCYSAEMAERGQWVSYQEWLEGKLRVWSGMEN